MKAKTKLTKLWTILLSLVMLLSLLPTTALAAGNYPDSVRVYNGSGKIIGLSDGQYLAANGDTEASLGYTDGTSYVARYDKSTGTLYLKDYHGVGKERGIAAASDLNIKVESNSSFTTSRTSNDNLMGIQADGKLSISGPGKLTLSATAPIDAYGIFAKEGVTISAPLDVTVTLKDSTKKRPLYGIYTKSGAISLSGGDKAITVTGGGSSVYGVYNAAKTSTSTVNGNIDISGKLTVNLNKGNNNVGIRTGSGGTITLNGATVNIPSNHYYGIYNDNGNVIIKNNSDVTLTSAIESGKGIYANYGGDLSIENSTVSISAKGYAANLEKGKLSIKNSTVDLTLEDTFYRVVATDNSATNTIDLSGSGSVTLTASGNQTSAMIGGKVTATSGTKLEKGTYYPGLETYDGEYDGSSKTVLQFVHEDPAPATTYKVTVTNGTGSGNYAEGETVTITANAASDGEMFDKWEVVSGSITLADATSETTTFTMPAGEVSVKATYRSYITINLAAGEGSGTMEPIIVKNTYGYYELTAPECTFTPPANKVFDKWQFSKDDSYLNPGDTKTIWSSANGSTLTAIWKDAPVTYYTVSGTATSFGSDTDNVILQLIAEGYSEADYEVFVQGNSANYSIAGVAPGTYTMKVMKNNHVTREYTVTVSAENVTQDVKIHLKGDINGDGKVNTSDVGKANSHAKGTSTLTGYDFACADVNGDGKVNTSDVGKINSHAKGTNKLW